MIRQYEKYKDSGVEWIGEIPEGWEVKKLKYVAEMKSGEGITSDQIREADDYPVYGGNGLRGYYDSFTHDGDFVLIGRQGALCGNINYATGKFWASEHAIVCALSSLFSPRWLANLLAVMNLNQYSVSAAQPGLSVENIKILQIPTPPLPEQTVIASFLDYKIAEIDQLIANKEKLIALYEEEKTTIINRAVTKGVDRKVKTKPSGVDWLGDIPEHWEVKRLKWAVSEKLKYGANESAEFDDMNWPRYIRITDFGDDGKLRSDTFKSLPYEVAKEYLLENGDILFARSGATVGKTFQFKNYEGLACFAGYLIKAKLKADVLLSDFLYFFSKSGAYDSWKNSIFNQATIQNIGADKYAFLEIPLPAIPEQTAIVSHIESECSRLDAIIDKFKKQIGLFKEYRTTLISEVVTGKIDVRDEVAA